MTSISDFVRTIPDHPKPGIQFRDITTLLKSPEGFRLAVEGLVELYRDREIDVVVGIEARGFIFGAAVAMALGTGFVPLRKPGKLPAERFGRDFDLEYGKDRLEMHVDAIEAGQNALVIDDLIATGGTAEAAVQLVRDVGARADHCGFVIALPDLKGIERLERLDCRVDWLCEFEGD